MVWCPTWSKNLGRYLSQRSHKKLKTNQMPFVAWKFLVKKSFWILQIFWIYANFNFIHMGNKKGNIKLNVLLALTRYCSFFFKSADFIKNIQLYVKAGFPHFNSAWKPRTTDTQWRHKSKISEKLGWCGRQNMLRPYLKTWGVGVNFRPCSEGYFRSGRP